MSQYDPDIHHRRSMRLPGYDYTTPGAYFLTVCTRKRSCLFGVVDGTQVVLGPAGRMVMSVWEDLPSRFPGITLDVFVVMPNHLHGIVLISDTSAGEPHPRAPHPGRREPCVCPPGTVDQRGEYEIRPYTGSAAAAFRDRPKGTDPSSVGRIVQAFKSITTHQYSIGVAQLAWPPFEGSLWQRNYYEHVIRGPKELDALREYIVNNPAQWALDLENPDL